jgi:hypothetical protein
MLEKYFRILFAVSAIFAAPVILSACDNDDGAFEETGEQLDETAENLGDRAEELTE